MITVIADDFTGAAEIAGLGLRYGLKVEIESDLITNSNADLLIIATDTRSLSSEDAYNEVYRITRQLDSVGYDWIYKKTDSVLRGHVYKELIALLKASNKSKVLLVPANPTLGRKIKDGLYYIDNKLLHETNFSSDPEFAITTSVILDLIGGNHVKLKKPGQTINWDGISIGEAESEEDLRKWAQNINTDVLPAGAAEFFAALLESKGYKLKQKKLSAINHLGKKRLFVCGSAFSRGKLPVTRAKGFNAELFPMPDDVFNNTGKSSKAFRKWLESIKNCFSSLNTVMIEIDQPVIANKEFSKHLREIIAQLVNEILKTTKVNELLIDGGATVYAIARKNGLNKFYPLQELAPGVIRMAVENHPELFVTIKPGSYSWPEVLLEQQA